MSKSLLNMVGSKILNISSIDDCWQINTDEFLVTIYNPFMVETSNSELMNVNETNINAFIDSIITNVIFQEEKQLILELDNNKKLYILLRDQDYSEPEALCLNYKSGEMIVVQ